MSKTTLLFVVLIIASESGCAVLLPDSNSSSHNLLTPITPPRDAIDLEVYFVDRIVGDPQLGDGLWNQLHAVTVVDPVVRDRLNEHGFRFAMSPSRAPQALQSLMSLSTANDPSRRALLQNYVVPSGQDALVMASALPQGTKVNIPQRNGVRTLEVDQGICMFRVKATSESSNWARVEVTPEIHYGQIGLRPKPTDHEWMVEQGQQSVKLYEDRLSVELNVGEVLVLGLAEQKPDSLGRHYFRSEADGREFERLILIRLARLSRVNPIRSDLESSY